MSGSAMELKPNFTAFGAPGTGLLIPTINSIAFRTKLSVEDGLMSMRSAMGSFEFNASATARSCGRVIVRRSSWQQKGIVSKAVMITVPSRSLSSFCSATELDRLRPVLAMGDECIRLATSAPSSGLGFLFRFPQGNGRSKETQEAFTYWRARFLRF